MKTAHTPTPWKTYGDSKDKNRRYIEAYGDGFASDLIADTKYLTADNAAFIVRACNSHDELVAALEAFVEHGERLKLNASRMTKARSILAKAKGDA